MKVDVSTAAREQWCAYLSRQQAEGRTATPEYRILEQLLERLDLDRYEEIRRELRDQGALGSEEKYLDLLYWTRSKLRILIERGIHAAPPQRVLDLGAGPGHFPFLCAHLGHSVLALDLGHIELYNRLVQFFDLQRVDHRIRAFEPLPDFPHRFDLVTGFMVGFNKRSKTELWGLPEWLFFLRDLADNVVSDDGRLVLKLIRCSRHRGLHFYDPEFVEFFTAAGGSVDTTHGYVGFESLARFREVPTWERAPQSAAA